MDYLVRINLVTGGNQTVRTKNSNPRDTLSNWMADGVIKTKDDEGTEIFIPWNAIVAFEFGQEAGAETVKQRDE